MDSDLKQDETDAQVAAKKAQAERDAAEAKRQADNKAAAAALASGAKPEPKAVHTRVSVSAASMAKHFEAYSNAGSAAFKEVNTLAAKAASALTDGNIGVAQETIAHLRTFSANQIEALRIPADIPTGGMHDNSGLSGGVVNHDPGNLHDYQANRINPVDQY